MTGLLSILIISFSLILIKNFYDTEQEILDLFDAQMAQSARVLLELSDHELHEQLAFAEQKLGTNDHYHTQIHKYQQEIDFQIWINGSHLAVRSEHAPTEPFTNIDNEFGFYKQNQHHWRVYSISNEANNIRVQVAQHYKSRHDLSNNISARLITSFALLLPLLTLTIIIVVHQALKPIKNIAKQLQSRQAGNLKPIDINLAPHEVQPMVLALNDLFYRLKNAFENIVLFTANAAHELRTPLAQQQIHAQVALNTNEENLRTEALEEVVMGVKRATSLVEQLLALSRLDPEDNLDNSNSANLKHIIQHQISALKSQADKKQITIHQENLENSVYVCGKKELLSVLVRNLIENAIRYSPVQGRIDVGISYTRNSIELLIDDSGPGIPEVEREQVFKRFYRIADNHQQEGTGLGLSIVKRIAEIHDAQIKLGRSAHQGLQVRIIFQNIDQTRCCNNATKIPCRVGTN